MWITSLCLSLVAQAAPETATLPATPEARRAAVESALVSEVWVEGHAFTLAERMRMLNVPGVSVAVIHDGRIDWAAGYGVRDASTGEPVTTETLFQAASISKPIGAMTAVRLAEDGILDLDAPINDFLGAWKLPDTGQGGTVTARGIMSHTAGLGVHGFPGYGTFEPLPSALEVVSGEGNTAAVEPVQRAGESVRYSGGGSTVLQLAMCTATGRDYADLVTHRVLHPLGMTRSTCAQPLPVDEWPDHAAGHDESGRVIPGRFRVHPEQFAAGLWTTAGDIARFALELQRVARYDNGEVLDAEWGQTMLAPVMGNAALGLFLEQHDDTMWFGHGGSNIGFKCVFRASLEDGRGVAVMTNGDQGSQLANEIVTAVAQVYGWPGGPGEPLQAAELSEDELRRYVGRYSFGPDEVLFVDLVDGRLTVQSLPFVPHPAAPLGQDSFQVLGSTERITFTGAGPKPPHSLTLQTPNGFPRRAKRIADSVYWPCQDLRNGNPHAAAAYYRDVHEINPDDPMVDAERLLDLADGLAVMGRPEAALALAETTAELYPASANARTILGQLQATAGKRQAAAASYRTALELLPKDKDLDDGGREWLTSQAESMLRWLAQ